MIALIGSVLLLVGSIWIAIIAFGNGETVWGICSIFCGIAAIIYAVQNFDEAKAPLGLMAVGFVMSIAGKLLQASG